MTIENPSDFSPEEQRQRLYDSLIRGLLSTDARYHEGILHLRGGMLISGRLPGDSLDEVLNLYGHMADGNKFLASDNAGSRLKEGSRLPTAELRRGYLERHIVCVDLAIAECVSLAPPVYKAGVGVYVVGKLVDVNIRALRPMTEEQAAEVDPEVPFVYEIGRSMVERPLEVPRILGVYRHLEQYS